MTIDELMKDFDLPCNLEFKPWIIARQEDGSIKSEMDMLGAMAQICDFANLKGRGTVLLKDLDINKIGSIDELRLINTACSAFARRPSKMTSAKNGVVLLHGNDIMVIFAENDLDAIEYSQIDNDETVRRLLLTEDAIEAARLVAVLIDPRTILRMQKPSDLVQIAAVLMDKFVFELLPRPSEQVKLALVWRDGLMVRTIDNPSEAIQLKAVEQNRRAIVYIKNPCAAAIEASRKAA